MERIIIHLKQGQIIDGEIYQKCLSVYRQTQTEVFVVTHDGFHVLFFNKEQVEQMDKLEKGNDL